MTQAEDFLRERFDANPEYRENPAAGAYRLEHSYRVANIGAETAHHMWQQRLDFQLEYFAKLAEQLCKSSEIL